MNNEFAIFTTGFLIGAVCVAMISFAVICLLIS